ncbi:MAG: hypothetical protein HQ561_16790 [Desulfobacteraceae bacterium]|nr:hypothetical protein [Desulfobacteraceae bacterium]
MGRELRKINHPAIAGFLLPFVAAAVTGALLLIVKEDLKSLKFSIPYLVLVPMILLGGLVSSLKSIPLIPERGDKDYTYSGLTLNILFLVVYVISLLYFFFSLPR